jgi:hypothetical protein
VTVVIVYFSFSTFIAIMPLIGPYLSASNTPQQVKGWYYITIVGAIVVAAVIYYYSAFGFAIDHNGQSRHQRRTILRLAGVYPEIHQLDVHEPRYGWRRKVEIIFPVNVIVSDVSYTALSELITG